MPPAVDLDQDWDVFWGKETVTVEGYDPAADAPSGSKACDAVVRAVGKREDDAPEGGRAFAARARVHLRKSQLDGPPGVTLAVTKRAVVVRADGSRWTVQSVSVEAMGTRYACECVQLS